ncbi:MAG: nucleotidyltransferase domain-containing protein, partial [Ignisphaera sp.]
IGIRYRRLLTVSEEYNYVISKYSRYLKFDDFFGREVVVVPLTDIAYVYNPLQRSKEIIYKGALENPVLKDIRDMVLDISESTGIKEIGVSGSILVNLFREDSDIDIVVYGVNNGLNVYKYLSDVIDKDPRYKRYRIRDIQGLHARRSLETPIPSEQLLKQESRKVLEGIFKGREYFIRLIKYHWEEPSYGSYKCVKLGKTTMKLRIIDSKESIFTPCRYRVEVIDVLEGVKADVVEVYSLRGRFTEVAQEDEVIIVKGTVERIEPLSGGDYYRLYLGDQGDYIMVID